MVHNNLNKPYNSNSMKRVMAIAFLGLTLTALLAACGGSGGGHCDAYGNKSGSVQQHSDQLPS